VPQINDGGAGYPPGVSELSALNRIRIEVDRDLCVGSGDCVDSAPDVFALDDEGKAVVLDTDAATVDDVVEAARNCPVTAIFVVGEEGEIYP
jgi:ferredoxin